MEEKLTKLPNRPNYGKKGRPVKVLVNYFEISKYTQGLIYHYDVEILAKDIPRGLRREIFTFVLKKYGAKEFGGKLVVYDGVRNAFCATPLPFEQQEFKIDLNENEKDKGGRKGRERKFTVIVKAASQVKMSDIKDYVNAKAGEEPLIGISALEHILREGPNVNLTPVGRSFFSGRKPFSISDGAEVWLGYQQSVRVGQGKVFLNLDMAATAFLQPGPLIDLVKKLIGRDGDKYVNSNRGLPRGTVARLQKQLRKVTVEVNHMKYKRKYKINKILSTDAKSTKFTLQETNKEVTVYDYFSERYKRKLKYPQLPLLHVGPPKKSIFIPMEIAFVVKGQRLTRKLTGRQTSDMIKITAQRPQKRQETIQRGVSMMIKKDDPYAKVFGVSVNPRMTEVKARELDPPKIIYNSKSAEKVVRPKHGSWMMKRSMLYQPKVLGGWAWVVLDKKKFFSQRDAGNFINVFTKAARELGITIKDTRPVLVYGDADDITSIKPSIIKAVKGVQARFNGKMPQLLVVILPRQNSSVYGEVKRVCDCIVDVPSQCMIAKNVKKNNIMYCKNVLLKVNVKLGGINSLIDKSPAINFFLSKPAIVFGADVTHPAPGSKLPSIAALVASMDAYAYKYATQTRSQDSRQEIITDLKAMIIASLKAFYSNTKKKPEKIIFYRDGVSEGQFLTVLQHEVTAIKEACRSLQKDYNPPVTFVVVQKRHHCRMFPIDKRDGDRSGNVKAGTVIDTVITHPTQFDFFLCSHGGIQGTSRPCYYHCLYDENRFTADYLQEFTYRMCYTYARCTKSVSLVPAAYYAHLVAFRARFHAQGDIYGDDDSFYSGSSGDMADVNFLQVKKRCANVMYFM